MSQTAFDPSTMTDEQIALMYAQETRRHAQLQAQQDMAAKDLHRKVTEMDRVKAEAKGAFGTDDPTKLEEIAADRRKRNASAVLAFRSANEGIVETLKQIETSVDA